MQHVTIFFLILWKAKASAKLNDFNNNVVQISCILFCQGNKNSFANFSNINDTKLKFFLYAKRSVQLINQKGSLLPFSKERVINNQTLRIKERNQKYPKVWDRAKGFEKALSVFKVGVLI